MTLALFEYYKRGWKDGAVDPFSRTPPAGGPELIVYNAGYHDGRRAFNEQMARAAITYGGIY
jgi:hypothetical protein